MFNGSIFDKTNAVVNISSPTGQMTLKFSTMFNVVSQLSTSTSRSLISTHALFSTHVLA